jgi:hypothetical protein
VREPTVADCDVEVSITCATRSLPFTSLQNIGLEKTTSSASSAFSPVNVAPGDSLNCLNGCFFIFIL